MKQYYLGLNFILYCRTCCAAIFCRNTTKKFSIQGNMKNYSAFLFDMDGTLVDTERLKGWALSETCNRFGGRVDIDIYKAVMGESWSCVANHFFKIAQIDPDIKEFDAEFRKIYQELLREDLTVNPNAREFLMKLKSKGKKTGVVSSGFRWMADQILTQCELSGYFDIIITQENVTRHKPDPESYLLALEWLSLPSSDVLIFEDSNAGLIAAKKANCDAIAFQHEFNINNDLSLAIKVISNFNEFWE